MKIGVISQSAGFHAQNNITPVLSKIEGVEVFYVPWHKPALLNYCDLIYLLGWYVSSFESELRHCELTQKGKPIILHWSGSDTLLCKQYKKDNKMFDYMKQDNVLHIAQKQELADEVKEFGITNVLISPIASRLELEPTPLATNLGGEVMPMVSTYIPPGRTDFFHLDDILAVAEKLPDIKFIICSFSSPQGSGRLIRDNVADWGKVGDKGIEALISECNMHLRLVDHDGFSLSVIENCLAGRRVITNWDYPHTHRVKLDVDDVVKKIEEIATIPEPDYECAEYYKKNYGAERYRNDITNLLREKGIM